DTDVYKFTVSTDSILSATITGLSELVQAKLFRDLNGDGVLAGDEQLEIRDNYYSGATLTFNGEPLMKGTYFLQVSPWNSEVNTAYTLAISAASIAGSQDAGGTAATARDFGTLTTAVQTVNDIAQWSDTDVYKFTVSSDSILSATITGLSELVQVRLFRDLNGDGILVSSDQLEIRDNYYSGATLTFNGEPLMKGTYYLQVSPWNSEVNTAYTLAISAAAIPGSQDAGGTTATARDFGTLTTTQQTVNDIAQSGDNDIFKFTLSTDSTLSATITGLSELVQARLFRDLNGDGILTSDEQLEVRDNYYSGATLTFNGESLMKGTYYLQVSPWNSEVNTAYTLAISAASIPGSTDAGGTVAPARNLGTLTATAQAVKDLAQSGDNDIYKFTLAPGAKLKAAITGLTELVQARLYRDLNNDGILTANEQIAYRDNYSSGASFDFNGLTLAGGTYFLQISPWNTEVNTEYQLTVSAV
ncbi:MAG: pre-peptidase C-terminal domain-containing protein, partial [Planctomycetota bacterium]|nr:pre-peptidase C-terminal domain-containing protein [Planctomycetota bacterium]